MKTSTRLHKLCSRALRAIDPQKLAGLNEIDGIFAESITELNVMLKDCTEIGLRLAGFMSEVSTLRCSFGRGGFTLYFP
jgi:hypothetical protein